MVASLPHRRALAFYGASQQRSSIPMLSTGEASLHEIERLRRRIADGYRNDPLIANGIALLRDGLVANPDPISDDPEVTRAFAAWAADCGYLHSYGSFAAIQRMVAHHLVQDGECFVQRVWSESRWSPNGLLLAVWPKRLVARERGHNHTGHEYEHGHWAGTWFQTERIEPGHRGYKPVFVSRADLIWVRYVFEGDQVEGVPRLHASIESAHQLAEYAQIALMQGKVSACLSAIAIAEDSILGPRLRLGPRITDSEGKPVDELYPGTIPIAHGIKSIQTVTPHQMGGNFSVADQTARVAAGAGLTTEIMSGTMGGASFSAARYAQLMLQRAVNALAIGYDQFRAVGIEWWKQAESMRGRDRDAVKFEWLARPEPSIDPVKQATADKIRIAIGIMSRREAICQSGRDPDQVFREIAAEREQLTERDRRRAA